MVGVHMGSDPLWESLKGSRDDLEASLGDLLDRAMGVDGLVVGLREVYGRALGVFGASGATPGDVTVMPVGDGAQVRCDDGVVDVVWTAQGWSCQFGLKGQWLGRFLASWPLFGVPDKPPPPVTEALVELRGLVHDPDRASMEALCALVDDHLDPAVRAYAREHAEMWSGELGRTYLEVRYRRFVKRGLQLLKQQLSADIARCIEGSGREHPNGASPLIEALTPVLEASCEAWNALMDTRAAFVVRPVRIGDGHGVQISDARDWRGLTLGWGESGWQMHGYGSETPGDVLRHIRSMIFRRHDPMGEDNWEEEDRRQMEAEAAHAQRFAGFGHVEEDLDNERPAWEEDGNWRLANMLDGLSSGYAATREREYSCDIDDEDEAFADLYYPLDASRSVIDLDHDPVSLEDEFYY